MKTKIFVMTHRKFEPPKDNMYVPLQVGHALNGTLDETYLRDDDGEDNISAWNPCFSELTGMYWVWKNYHGADNVGVCHYRRYPVLPVSNGAGAVLPYRERLLTQEDCARILQNYDCITTQQLSLHSNYYEGFAIDHNIRDLQTTETVIREKAPAYYNCFKKSVHKNKVYFGNICVMPKRLYDSYCEWLFAILFEVRKRIDTTGYDDYRKRVFGFLSEFLQMVWVQTNRLHPYECRVAIIGEKFETKEVKRAIEGYFARKDIQGAKNYFLQYFQKRPDILMEASDITGDLRICMQIISTCEHERRLQNVCILDQEQDLNLLISLFRHLNTVIQRKLRGEESAGDEQFLKSGLVSEPAMQIAAMLANEKL